MYNHLRASIMRSQENLKWRIEIILDKSFPSEETRKMESIYKEIRTLEKQLHIHSLHLPRSMLIRGKLARLDRQYKRAIKIFDKKIDPQRLVKELQEIVLVQKNLKISADLYGNPTTDAPRPKDD